MTGRRVSKQTLGFVSIVVIALVAGYVGLWQFVHSPHGAGVSQNPLNLFYYDLQLFALDSKALEDPGPYPLLLDIARFLAPAATVYALIQASRALFAEKWKELRTRRTRGHAVVTGDTVVALALAVRLRAAGTQVVTVGGATDLTDPSDPHALRDAGIAGADVLYACADDLADSAVNVATAWAATGISRRGGTKLRIYAQVSEPILCTGLRTRRLGVPDVEGLHLDFFNIEELAGRELARQKVAALHGRPRPSVVVAGGQAFGQELIVELARQWRLHSTDRLAVTLIDPEATRIGAELTGRYVLLGDTADITPFDGTATAFRNTGPAPDQVFICYEDEEVALRTALTATQLWLGGDGKVIVRLNRLARLNTALNGRAAGADLLENLGERLRFVSVTELACTQEVLHEDLIDRLARAVHERYLIKQVSLGAPLGQSPPMLPWDELSDDLKDSNRDQSRDIGRKLKEIGCTVVPRTGAGGGFAYRDGELERLSIQEHDRYVANRVRAGWVLGPEKDFVKKTHPSLGAWADLPESEKEKDRDVLRNLPDVLADAGLTIVRL